MVYSYAMRPETGPMKFGEDWTGVFIRGDDAMYFKMCLSEVIGAYGGGLNPMTGLAMQQLADLFGSANEHEPSEVEPQLLLSFEACKR